MIKKIVQRLAAAFGLNLVLITATHAHCPLCTVGAGAAALAASWLGVSSFSVGIFIGAFAVAIGLWMGKWLRKKIDFVFIPYLLAVVSFVTTVFPLKPLLFDNASFYLSLYGDYGTWLNRTYFLDKFLAGSVLGALLLLMGPFLSKALSKARKGALWPYQGMAITFGLLFAAALFFEILQ